MSAKSSAFDFVSSARAISVSISSRSVPAPAAVTRTVSAPLVLSAPAWTACPGPSGDEGGLAGDEAPVDFGRALLDDPVDGDPLARAH